MEKDSVKCKYEDAFIGGRTEREVGVPYRHLDRGTSEETTESLLAFVR